MAFQWRDHVVLVTGGTGSFGQKFVRRMLAKDPPRKLIVFSRDELKQHDMQQQFRHPNLRYFVGDVRDRERLYRAMKGVDIVVHAAALKQVPSCEYNPFEAVKTNILGASNVIDAALDCGVKRVLALSTDKAVNPVNLYGATKLCAEKLFVQGNAYTTGTGARMACVRYGNVVGSRGSVIPLFLAQKPSGVITITDDRMTRFWLTLEQGVEFVVQSVELMHGGEVFVPKIPSMRVIDLARAVAPECRVETIGIRPGEKLHEVLLTEDEARHARSLDEFFIITPEHAFWDGNVWAEGKELPDGFRYSSDQNDRWLGVDELRSIAGLD
jgi:UDP-N-acetylglucosamine 4,6-dehydratase